MTLSKKMQENAKKIANALNASNKLIILRKIHRLVKEDNPKPRTLTVRYSLIKDIFKDVTNDQEFLKKIRPNANITLRVVKSNIKQRDNQKMIEIHKKDIKKIMSFAKSKDIFKLAIYLLFVTGRRISELLGAEFFSTKKPYLVKIRGVLKRTDNVDCEFPLLINKAKFFKIMKRFKDLQTYTNMDTFHRLLNNKVKILLENDKLKPHSLRGMYITYLFKFRNKDNLKINTFIKKNLCHQSIDASMNYTQYKINDDMDSDIVK